MFVPLHIPVDRLLPHLSAGHFTRTATRSSPVATVSHPIDQ